MMARRARAADLLAIAMAWQNSADEATRITPRHFTR
eukprot:COSAG04_NODE_27_length_37012_cov_29.502127_27_plen_36_part_00